MIAITLTLSATLYNCISHPEIKSLVAAEMGLATQATNFVSHST